MKYEFDENGNIWISNLVDLFIEENNFYIVSSNNGYCEYFKG